MSLGGLVAGLAVALLAGLVTRLTPLREDAAFAAFYLTSLALGVLIVSLQRQQCRSAERAVRLGARGRRPGAAAGRQHRPA